MHTINPLPNDTFTDAEGVNNSGQVVGYSFPTSGGGMSGVEEEAFLYSQGTTTDLGTLPGGNSVLLQPSMKPDRSLGPPRRVQAQVLRLMPSFGAMRQECRISRTWVSQGCQQVSIIQAKS